VNLLKIFQTGISYRTLESASPTFSLDYYTDICKWCCKKRCGKQSEVNFQVEYTLKEKTIDLQLKENVDSPYSRFFCKLQPWFQRIIG
jgi:hypothetical protein